MLIKKIPVVLLRSTEEIKSWLVAKAVKEERSLNSVVNRIIKEAKEKEKLDE